MSEATTAGVTAWEPEGAAMADDAPVAPIGVSAQRAALLLLAVLVIALTSRQGALAAEDATVFLNARNGFAQSPVLFFYAGYASLAPDVVSWLLRPLPLAAQAVGYMAAAIAMGVLLGEEAFRLLRRFMTGAVALAGAVFLLWLTHNQSGLVFLNLTYLIWPGLLWGGLRLARAAAEERAPGWVECALLVLIGLSQPLAAAWAPGLAWLIWASKGPARWRLAGALAVIVVYDAANLLLAPHVVAGLLPFGEAWRRFMEAEGHLGWRDGVVHLAAVACLAAAGAVGLSVFRAGGALRRRDRALLQLLGFAVLATVAYLVSDRFLLYRTLVERYGLAALVAGAAAGIIALAPRVPSRFATLTVAGLLLLPAANLARGHLGRQLTELGGRIAFLQEADRWRTACRGDTQVRAQTPADRWSLVLPCRHWAPQSADGFYRALPSGDLAFVAQMSLEGAGVYVGAPLGPVRRATP